MENKKKSSRPSLLKDLFRKKPLGGVGLIIMLLFLLVAIFADQLAPYPMQNGSMQMDFFNMLSTSSPQHLLGTDDLGQDVLSYLIYGCRTSVVLAIFWHDSGPRLSPFSSVSPRRLLAAGMT